MQPSDEIKSRLDIVDVIREYIQLKPAGMNFRASCPFHKEKTPSFMVSPEKQIWHCFGCSKGGDMFSFVMEIEGLDFVEALRMLAPKAGVTLKRGDPKLASQRNRLLDIMEASRNYYHEMLLSSGQAQAIRDYLAKRGILEETIEDWQLGYSLDEWENLGSYLKNKGFSENEIFLAGMSIRSEKRPGFYDRFRGRLMFPINDINGNTVAFSARVDPAKEETEKMGKYINSPQTLLYDKSKILFGLDKAKLNIKEKEYVIIVEGQMDAVTAHQHGYKNVVASSGTALTREQVALIKRYSENIMLAFDMDAAGERASERGAREAMRAEMNIKMLLLPKGMDPDECIRKDPNAWQTALEQAAPIMEYFFSQTTEGLDLDKVENKRKIVKKLLPIIGQLGNPIEQEYWLRELSQLVSVSEQILKETLAKTKPPVGYDKPEEDTRPTAAPVRRLTREEKMSEVLLALVFKFPDLIEYASQQAVVYHLAGDFNQWLYKNLVIYYNKTIEYWTAQGELSQGPQISYNHFKEWLLTLNKDNQQDNQLGKIDRLVLLGDKDFQEFSLEQAKREIINIIVYLKKHYTLTRMREVEKLIAESEKNNETERIDELMREFKGLVEEFRGIGE